MLERGIFQNAFKHYARDRGYTNGRELAGRSRLNFLIIGLTSVIFQSLWKTLNVDKSLEEGGVKILYSACRLFQDSRTD